ncbi:ent-kaurene oxidase [Naviculisporaceae sp. PSN 640]
MEVPFDAATLLRPVFLVPVALLISYIVYHICNPSPISQLSKTYKLPIAGARKGDWFPYTQARWRNFFNFQSALLEAERLSRTADPNKPHQAVLLPVLGTPNLVQLPQSEIQFVAEQPQTTLSAHDHATGRLQIENTLTDPRLLHNPVHNRVIATSLGAQTGNLIPDLVEETASVFQEQWGTSDDFREVNALNTLRQVVARITYRVFLSAPLCRDQRIQKAAMAVFDSLSMIAEMLNLLWDPILPLLAPLITIPVKWKFRHFINLLMPEVTRRLGEYDVRRQTSNPEKDIGPEKNDFLQWNLNHAKASGDPYMYSPSTLAGRILIVAFAGVHTTTFAITHAVLDIAYSPAPIRSQIISELREEISTCLNTHSDGVTFTKQALTSMFKLDSLLRESTRLNSLVTIGLARRCTASNGLTTPYSKITVPKGATVAVPAYTAFRSPELYDNPEEFQPFRFVQQRVDEKKPATSKGFASTGLDYLAFGHGKTACPGRFFVANELKLVLAYVLLNYDIEPAVEGMERPENKWYGISMIPDLNATVRIRRRSEGF